MADQRLVVGTCLAMIALETSDCSGFRPALRRLPQHLVTEAFLADCSAASVAHAGIAPALHAGEADMFGQDGEDVFRQDGGANCRNITPRLRSIAVSGKRWDALIQGLDLVQKEASHSAGVSGREMQLARYLPSGFARIDRLLERSVPQLFLQLQVGLLESYP